MFSLIFYLLIFNIDFKSLSLHQVNVVVCDYILIICIILLFISEIETLILCHIFNNIYL